MYTRARSRSYSWIGHGEAKTFCGIQEAVSSILSSSTSKFEALLTESFFIGGDYEGQYSHIIAVLLHKLLLQRNSPRDTLSYPEVF